jgi:hypothetical protein
MPSDISLAVGDGARRMTYAELADIRRISMASAMRLVRRKNWPRQVGNDGVVRILVPLSAAGDSGECRALSRGETTADKQRIARSERSRTSRRISDRTSGADKQRTITALESAIAALREQLMRSEARADSLQDELTRERSRAAALGRKLIEVLTGPTQVPWWRRWFR